MTKDEIQREALQHFMSRVDSEVNWLERQILASSTDSESKKVWQATLKLFKRAQAIGVREAIKVGFGVDVT